MPFANKIAPVLWLLIGLSTGSAALGQATQAEVESTQPTGTQEEVRIPSEKGVMLAATLRLPSGTGRHPALVIQSGSGPSKRGGYVSLEHRLNAAGIATIEFDKRGVGQSTGRFTDTMQDMEADLAATIAWLRKRADIDGSRIALLGHSQGAAAVPVVADRDRHVAALIFLSGPVGGRGTMFLEAMRAQLIEGGHTPSASDKVVAATRIWMEDRDHGAPNVKLFNDRAAVVAEFRNAGFTAEDAEGATKVLDSAQLLSMYDVAPGTALSHLQIPVLALFGARDEFFAGVDQAAKAAAALGENRKALVVEVPGANHGFGYRRTDAPPRANPGGGSWLSMLPENLIADWLRYWLLSRR